MCVGSVVTAVRWCATPDKYGAPAMFDDLDRAKAHAVSGVVTVELDLITPQGRHATITGGVPSADSMFRRSPHQHDGVLPVIGSVLLQLTPISPANTALPGRYQEIVFRTPTASQFVVLAAQVEAQE